MIEKKAQVMVEFTFCMIILFLMMYGIVMVFRWVGLDLGRRQQAHETVLTENIDPAYGSTTWTWNGTDFVTTTTPVERGPLTQIDPYFYTPGAMNAVWAGN